MSVRVLRDQVWSRLRAGAAFFAPVDIASLVFFRIGLGGFLAWWAWDYLASGRVRYYYVEPQFHFTWRGFDWVQPWPGIGMYVHFVALAILGLAIAAGCFYRAACVLFGLGFLYVFLLDATNYQNHYYLLLLLVGVMAVVPANRAVSVDAAWRLAEPSQVAPRWCLWLVRFHVALPYVFGGLAKLDGDWLSGLPMRQLLVPAVAWPVVGEWLGSREAALGFAWGGLVFDLVIVPLLLWQRTRGAAFVLAVLFHATNSALFSIHIFPWFMIFASTVFFEPDWPRRVLGGRDLDAAEKPDWLSLAPGSPLVRYAIVAALLAWCGFQVLWPLRHYLHGENVHWTERGHYFSWRMMLRNKVAGVRYYVTDTLENKTWNPDLRPYLNPEQAGKFTKDPDMIVQLARFLASEERRRTGHPIEVRAVALVSLNGRKAQAFLDPEVNLAAELPHAAPRRWILPLTEVRPAEPWDKAIGEWEKLVEFREPRKVTAR